MHFHSLHADTRESGHAPEEILIKNITPSGLNLRAFLPFDVPMYTDTQNFYIVAGYSVAEST